MEKDPHVKSVEESRLDLHRSMACDLRGFSFWPR